MRRKVARDAHEHAVHVRVRAHSKVLPKEGVPADVCLCGAFRWEEAPASHTGEERKGDWVEARWEEGPRELWFPEGSRMQVVEFAR